ncbi:MAG: 6-phosphogluconolactonase [Pseudomonadota bacterium]
MTHASDLVEFEDRSAAAGHVAALIEGALCQSIGSFGEAGLWVSGGTTPIPVFERLSRRSLAWSQVRIGLVDERFVPESDPRSNAGLVKSHLMQGHAAKPLNFLPMVVSGRSAAESAGDMDTAYQEVFAQPPVVLLGMGSDGHTASWFPGAPGLEAVMSPGSPEWIAPIDATGAPGAGEAPYRLTLTGAALAACSFAILFLTGPEKRANLEDRAANLPIHRAERLLGGRLSKVWAP